MGVRMFPSIYKLVMPLDVTITPTPTLDGQVGENSPDSPGNWADGHDAPGDFADDETDTIRIGFRSSTGPPGYYWYEFERGILLVDISRVPPGAIFKSASLDLYGNPVTGNSFPGLSPSLNIFSSAPASNTALVPGDFDSLGTTPLSTAIAMSSFDKNGYNNYPFNPAGLALLQAAKIGDGIAKFGLREATYDAPDVVPTWTASKSLGFIIESDELVASTYPVLTVAYEI